MNNIINKKSKEAGVTSIAIVCTSILALIIAGVSISLIMCENGVLEQSQHSSNIGVNTKEEVIDIDEDSKRETTTISNSTSETTTTPTLEPTTSITIKDIKGTKIDLANISNYYGYDVIYSGQTYQLFLVDTEGKYSNGEPRIWLQHKDCISGVQLSSHYDKTGISTENSILWQVNPDLNSKFGSTIRALDNWDGSIQGVAYLCNPKNWNSVYLSSEDITAGAFAIGGVSAEMFCDSYNQARGKTSTDPDYFDAKAFDKKSTYGYAYKPNDSKSTTYEENYAIATDNTKYAIETDNTKYPIPSSTYGGMYNPGKSKATWLASPIMIIGGGDVCVCGRCSEDYLML